MHLTQPKDFLNGIVTPNAYIEISSYNVDLDNKTANIQVKTFLNDETKLQKLNPIVPVQSFYFNNTTPIGEVKEPFYKFVTSDGSIKGLYNFLLTQEDFKTATIVE